MVFGGLDSMWIVVMFDLPTDTKAARRAYTQFRKQLITDGFIMMQYSVYARHCGTDDNAQVHINRTKGALPDDGEVRILTLTDKQFSKVQTFYGKIRKPTEKAPEQLQFF